MKKLIFVLALMFTFTVISIAQTVTITGAKDQQHYRYTKGVNIDTTTVLNFVIKTDAQWPTTQHAHIVVDSVWGNHTAVALLLFGRNFDNSAWTSISSTIVDQGVDAAVPITLTNTTETRWRQFKLQLTGTGNGRSRVSSLDFLILKPD